MSGNSEPMRSDDTSASQSGEQIDRLLDELHSVVGPIAWSRIEALVSTLVNLYGEGLERLLHHAHEAALNREHLDEKLMTDELVSSLLLVHGLHPLSIEDRIELALDRLRVELPSAMRLELASVDDTVARLRPSQGSNGALPSIHVVARAIEHEAPEVSGVQIDGAAPTPPASDIVPVERLRRGRS